MHHNELAMHRSLWDDVCLLSKEVVGGTRVCDADTSCGDVGRLSGFSNGGTYFINGRETSRIIHDGVTISTDVAINCRFTISLNGVGYPDLSQTQNEIRIQCGCLFHGAVDHEFEYMGWGCQGFNSILGQTGGKACTNGG
jgi:hypothetical protein